MENVEITQLLEVCLSPVALISGIGLLLLSMTNRFGRAIDRARDLQHAPQLDEHNARYARLQVKVLYRRATMLRNGIALAIFSVTCVGVVIFCLFADQVFGTGLSIVALIAFAVSLAALVGSLIMFARDVSLSLRALRLELFPADVHDTDVVLTKLEESLADLRAELAERRSETEQREERQAEPYRTSA